MMCGGEQSVLTFMRQNIFFFFFDSVKGIQEDSIVLRADGGYITSTADHGYLLMESTVIPVYPVYGTSLLSLVLVTLCLIHFLHLFLISFFSSLCILLISF